MITYGVSVYIQSARHRKANGDLFGHKHCLRMARREVNFLRLTRAQPRHRWPRNTDGVVVQVNPRLPGMSRPERYVGRKPVVVIGSPGYNSRGFGKSIALMLALSVVCSVRTVRRDDLVIYDEADKVGLDGWDKLIGRPPAQAICLGPGTPCSRMHGIGYAPLRGKELRKYNDQRASKGDRIRTRKMFGGWS